MQTSYTGLNRVKRFICLYVSRQQFGLGLGLGLLSVRESVKFCERIAMLCLKRMEDPSMYGSERLFNQSVATIMDAEADEIEHYKAL